MGGKITIESELNQGTTFKINIVWQIKVIWLDDDHIIL
jgi:chemotaxis protein histidine kinase CheA